MGEGKKPVDAYLDIEDIIRIAKEHGVDAIHPGYGFLAENAEFARRCEEEGIIFIGPKVEHLVMFGDKVNARIQAEKAGIPMIPGTKGAVKSYEEVKEFAEKYGFPVMIKAVNGGGGRGMRNVDRMEDLEDAYHRAKSEAKMAFGDDDVYVERCIMNPKHMCRSWATSMAISSTSSNGTAPSSAATRRSSRWRRHGLCRKASGRRSATPPSSS